MIKRLNALEALAGVALAVITAPAWSACECVWQGSFIEAQARADVVLAGEIVSAKGNSVDLRIDQTLRGDTLTNPVRVWLKAKDYCRPDAETFPKGTQWVMALQKITEDVPGGFNPSTPNISYGRIGDYSLSSCGGYWLQLREGRVSGNLIDAPRWERDPKMSPVLLDLIAGYLDGKVARKNLLEASREDPALRELMLDTRSFLRNTN